MIGQDHVEEERGKRYRSPSVMKGMAEAGRALPRAAAPILVVILAAQSVAVAVPTRGRDPEPAATPVSSSDLLVAMLRGKDAAETARAYTGRHLRRLAEERSVLGAGLVAERLLARQDAPAGEKVRIDIAVGVPDLDGDHRDDFVKLHYLLTPGEVAFNGTLEIQALQGLDARPLWRLQVVTEEGLPLLRSARVGKGGRNGIVVEELSFTSSPTSYLPRMRLIGVTGKGKVSWERTFEVDATNPLRVEDVPLMPGFSDMAPGRATDMLIGLVTLTGPSAGLIHAQVAETTAVIVDGTSGELFIDPRPERNWSTSPRPTVLEYQGEWIPTPLPATDVSRDGDNDYVFVTARPRHDGHVSLRSAIDGTEIWSAGGIPIGTFTDINGRADLDGDGIPDLLLTTMLFEPQQDDSLPHGDLLTAIAGVDGEVLWSGTGRHAHVLGDVDGDADDDVGTSSTFFSHDDSEAGIRYEGFSGSAGDPLYSVPHTLRYLGAGGLLQTWMGSAGDLDTDRIPDFFYDQSLQQDGAKMQRASKMISGRNGRKIAQGNPWLPLGVSLDGRGADIVRVTFDKERSRLEVTAADGRAGRPLWRARYSMRERVFGLDEVGIFASAHLFAGRVSADRCNDVAIYLDGPRGGSFLVVLDGRDGSPLWSLRLEGRGSDVFGSPDRLEGRTDCRPFTKKNRGSD